MKKILLIALVVCLPTMGHAIFDAEDNNAVLNYIVTANTASTATIAIDLSDTSNYVHDNTGGINLSGVMIDIFRATNASGTLKLGVVTRSGAANGDITNFISVPFDLTTDTFIPVGEIFSPSVLKTKVNKSAGTSHIASSDIDISTGAIVNTLALTTSLGSLAIPAVGDIILSIVRTNANSATFAIRLFYHSER